MAPPAALIDVANPLPDIHIKTSASSRLAGPLRYSGSLDSYEQFDVTAVIGHEFPKLQISDILHDDAKIRDLAILGLCDLTTNMGRRDEGADLTVTSVSARRRLLPQPGLGHR